MVGQKTRLDVALEDYICGVDHHHVRRNSSNISYIHQTFTPSEMAAGLKKKNFPNTGVYPVKVCPNLLLLMELGASSENTDAADVGGDDNAWCTVGRRVL